MSQLGWDSYDRILKKEWENTYIYSIYFERWDWHGTPLGIPICYTCIFYSKSSSLEEEDILKAVNAAKKLAKNSWEEKRFPLLYETIKKRGEVIIVK